MPTVAVFELEVKYFKQALLSNQIFLIKFNVAVLHGMPTKIDETPGINYFRKLILHGRSNWGGRDAVDTLALIRGNLGVDDAVNSIGFGVKAIEVEFIIDERKYQNRAGNSNGQPKQVDQRISSLFAQISKCDDEIAFNHDDSLFSESIL